MTSSDIIGRALSLADLTNSQFISYSDQTNSLNESFKDIYNELTNSNVDYFLKEAEIVVTTAMQGLGPYQYIVPLPADCYKLRYSAYMGPQGWTMMKMWNQNLQEDLLLEPEYRLRGLDSMWIVTGSSSASIPFTIKIGYYTPPPVITLPGPNYQFGQSYSAANFGLINANTPFYSHYQTASSVYDVMVYAYNNSNIVIEVSQNSQVGQPAITPMTIYTDPTYTIEGLFYYKGYLYWINSNNAILSAPFDVTNPSIITTPITVLAGSSQIGTFLHVANNTIYYSQPSPALTRTITITSPGVYGSPQTLFTFQTYCVQVIPNGNVYYVDVTGNVWANTTPTPTNLNVGYTAYDLANDGTNLYVLDGVAGNVWAYPIPSFGVLGTGTIIATGVIDQIGEWVNFRLPLLFGEAQTLFAYSTNINYDFSSYLNIVPEIMSYQCAADFKRKQSGDPSMLMARRSELWKRMDDVVRKDEYRFERVQNYYKNFNAGLYS